MEELNKEICDLVSPQTT